jgi:hypothetical protein
MITQFRGSSLPVKNKLNVAMRDAERMMSLSPRDLCIHGKIPSIVAEKLRIVIPRGLKTNRRRTENKVKGSITYTLIVDRELEEAIKNTMSICQKVDTFCQCHMLSKNVYIMLQLRMYKLRVYFPQRALAHLPCNVDRAITEIAQHYRLFCSSGNTTLS